MNLTINGNEMAVPKNIQTISQLIEHLEITNPVVIVEHNNNILEKEEHEKTSLTDGDQVEFIQFVGGG